MVKNLAVLKSPILAPADVPEWWKFLPAGEVHILGQQKPLILDDAAAAMIMAYFESLGRDIVIDYEHQTLKDIQAPAAGWIHQFDWRGADGLWVRTSWTERAAAYIAAKEYRYFSPVMFSRKSDNRIVAIANAALTNEPKTRHLAAIAAKLEIFTQNPEEQDMFKKLIQIFKLKDDADQAAVEAAAEAVVAKNDELKALVDDSRAVVACKGVLDALKLPADADEPAVVAKIGSLTATAPAAGDLARQVVELSGKIADMQVDQLTGQALKNGQTSPDELKKWGNDLARKDPEQFKQIVCSRPVGSVIPVTRTPVVPDENGASSQDDAVATVAKMMGVSDADLKQYGGQD